MRIASTMASMANAFAARVPFCASLTTRLTTHSTRLIASPGLPHSVHRPHQSLNGTCITHEGRILHAVTAE